MPARLVSRFCVDLVPGAPEAGIGGKARSLLRLREVGLPVPPAFAVSGELFLALRRGGPPLPPELAAAGALSRLAEAAAALRAAPWPRGFEDELRAAVAALPPATRLAVRSSGELEDDPDALGAGLYLSRVNVPLDDLDSALRDVLASALAPAAAVYLGARGRSPDQLPMAVLIHPFVEGTVDGTAARDTPADSSSANAIIEARGTLGAGLRGRIEGALATLAARHGAVEVEWVATGDDLLFLQLRPFVAGGAGPRATPDDGQDDWRWDATHNPLPLSPAQADVVAFVDAQCALPFAQRVAGGYLFYRPTAAWTELGSAERSRPGRSKEPSEGSCVIDASRAAVDPRDALARLQEMAERRLAMPEPLEAALETFRAIYEPLFAVVQPAARRARERLAAWLTERGFPAAELLPRLLAGVPSAATMRALLAGRLALAATDGERAAARDAYVAAFGDEAPVWDVAVPTWREQPQAIPVRGMDSARAGDRLLPDATAAGVRDRCPAADRDAWDRIVAAARDAAAVAEDDDALYARAQAHVRRALLAEGDRLRAAAILQAPSDVFWLPFELVRRLARGQATVTREEAARLIGGARAADAEARRRPPRLTSARASAAGWVRGRGGSPGARVGIVRHWPVSPEAAATNEPPVIVARTILPTELPLVSAAAMVVETGGVLDHVAAQARERGIPAVVGAAGALAMLADGDRVLVDGDAGLVMRLGEAAARDADQVPGS